MEQLPNTPSQPVAYKSSKSLAIALVVSAVFLVAAVGVGLWLINKPAGSTTVFQQPTGDGSDKVKKVSFIVPAGLPDAYAKREQNTQTTATTYYFNPASGCGITTNVQPMLPAPAKPKDVVAEAAKATQSYGITTASVADASDYRLKDADGQHTYTFPSIKLEQTVNVSGVAYNAQRNVIAYKQFGTSVASIGYSCKNDSWDGKKAELETLISAFIVKTEK